MKLPKIILYRKVRKVYDITDEFGTIFDLVDETGGWAYNTIYVYMPAMKNVVEVFGIIVHEFVEMILEANLRMDGHFAHQVANVAEFVLTMGQTTVYWRSKE